MAVIKNGVGYFAICDHVDHGKEFPAALWNTSMTEAIQSARRQGWHVSLTNRWANCPDCHSLFGLNKGKDPNKRGKRNA